MRRRERNDSGAARSCRLFWPIFLTAALAAASARAGPCSAEIGRLQAAVDARIAAVAGSSRTARESAAATEHHEPTPGSIAQAEESLGEGSGNETALAALARARQADAAGDATSCERALAEIRAVLER
jgi:hypothetical protein